MAANKQGWEDFSSVVGLVSQLRGDIKKLGQNIGRLKAMKAEIMDDPVRKAELKKIIDQHPDFTITSLGADFTKLIWLQTWLESNEYLVYDVPEGE